MSKIERFEDLIVWQEGIQLAVLIYKTFSDCKEFGLKDQVCRSAVSISSNIAEGFDRHSNKEFIRFLRIAKGSTAELRTQLLIAFEVNIISSEQSQLLISKTYLISGMLQNLIKTRETRFS